MNIQNEQFFNSALEKFSLKEQEFTQQGNRSPKPLRHKIMRTIWDKDKIEKAIIPEILLLKQLQESWNNEFTPIKF
tara:strand:+ start:263 stop:490 length:228 start_codon:yes stop_codon:yes gene_type:complete